MDKGINKRINNMKDSEPNEQSPLTCLTKRLMDVHIDTKYHVFTRKPTSLCVEDAIRKPSLSDSEDSVYFSAKSSQSYGDDDRTSLSSREESTLNTVQLCAKNFEDEIGSSDSSDTLLPSTTHSQRDKSPVEDRCVDYSLLKKFDPLCVNNSQSLTESAFSETATLKFKRISTEYDYDEFAELIDKNRANFQMGEVDIKTDERQANLNVDEVTNVNEPDDNNDIDTDTNDEIFNIDAVKELIADMYAVIQDLLTTLEDNTNVRESEQVEMLSLRNERLQAELFDIETSYGQLHDRYEKLRTALEDAVNIAEEWKIRSDELTGFCEYERERYQKLKTACEDKLIDVINERNRIKSDHEKQMHTMEASLRKANLTIEDLSNTLDMKNDQILKLNKICDDLLRFKE